MALARDTPRHVSCDGADVERASVCRILSARRSNRGQRRAVIHLSTTFELLFVGLMTAILMSVLHGWSKSTQTTGNTQPVLRLAATSDGQQLWIRRGTSEVISYDLQTREIQKVMVGNHNLILGCLVSDDGQTFLVSTDAHDLRIFREHSLVLFEPAVGDVTPKAALSANGRTAVRLMDGRQVQCWDLSSDSPLESSFELPLPADRISLDSSGRWLVAATEQGVIYLCDVISGGRCRTLMTSTPLSSDPVISRDGLWLILGRRSSVDLFNLSTGLLEWSIPIKTSDGIQAAAISRDGNWIAASGIASGVQLIDRASGQVRQLWQHGAGLHRIAFSADNQSLYVGQEDGSVKACSVTGGYVQTLLAAPTRQN